MSKIVLTEIQRDCLDQHGITCDRCKTAVSPCEDCQDHLKAIGNPCLNCVHWRPSSVLPRGCRVRYSEGVAELVGLAPPKVPTPPPENHRLDGSARVYGHYCTHKDSDGKECRRFFESLASRASFCPVCRPRAYERPRPKACETCRKVFVGRKKARKCPDCSKPPKKEEFRPCRDCKVNPVAGSRRAKLCKECRRRSTWLWKSKASK